MCIVGIADVVHLVLIWTKYLLVSRMHTRQQKRQSALCHSLHAVPSVSLTNIAMFKRTCNSARLLSFRWQINLFFNINRWLTLGYLKNKFFLFCFLFNKNLGMRQMTKHTKVLPPKVFFFFYHDFLEHCEFPHQGLPVHGIGQPDTGLSHTMLHGVSDSIPSTQT